MSEKLTRLFKKQAKPSRCVDGLNSPLGQVSDAVITIIESRERFNATASVNELGDLILRITGKGKEPVTLQPSPADFMAVVNCIVHGRVGMVTPLDVSIMNSQADFDKKFIKLAHYKSKEISGRVFYTRKDSNVELKLRGRNGYLRFKFTDEEYCLVKGFKL